MFIIDLLYSLILYGEIEKRKIKINLSGTTERFIFFTKTPPRKHTFFFAVITFLKQKNHYIFVTSNFRLYGDKNEKMIFKGNNLLEISRRFFYLKKS